MIGKVKGPGQVPAGESGRRGCVGGYVVGLGIMPRVIRVRMA
jgi:hypothetical protein